jgi:hypothetical protein
MVTAAESQDPDEFADIIDSVDTEEESQVEGLGDIGSAPLGGVDVAPSEPTDGLVGATEAPPSPPTAPQADERALQELQQRRAAEQERTWREQVGRQARAYEQRLQEGGYMPEQARDQARRYVQQEQKFRKQDEEASRMVGFVQGRQAAAVHFMKKHGLANDQIIADLMALQQTNSPAEMEKEARRMKDERALRAENAQLKQGRVPPQTFDNSQGAAESSSNDNRLLDAYNNGDRSEAAIRAARRLALGS